MYVYYFKVQVHTSSMWNYYKIIQLPTRYFRMSPFINFVIEQI